MAYLPDNKYKRRKATNFIVVHCSALDIEKYPGVEELRQYHIEERKWLDIGYHYVVRRDGTRELGRPTWAVGAHVEGHNEESVAICLVGGTDEHGKPENNFTPEQFTALTTILYYLKRDQYQTAQVVGHCDIQIKTDKACPCFDVKKWWAGDEKTVQKEITQNACIAR